MFNLEQILTTAGYLGFFLIILAESGFFLGFFFPGDSLIFTAGIFASRGYFNIWVLFALCVLGTILGDTLGYWTGKIFGPKLFNREDSLLFKKKYVEKTKTFYDKHGKKTIILARFVPIVRTFAPIMAGVGEMPYGIFLPYNIIGGIFWPIVYLAPAYIIGTRFSGIENYFTLIVGAIILISILPIGYEMWKEWGNGNRPTTNN